MKIFYLLFTLSLISVSKVKADDIETFVRRECPDCEMDAHREIMLRDRSMKMKVFRVTRNTIELSLFFMPDQNGTYRVEYNADSAPGGRQAEAQRLCSELGNFTVRSVNYRNVFNTTQHALPSASYQTINILTCIKGRGRPRTGEQRDSTFTVKIAVPPIQMDVPMPINVDTSPRFLQDEREELRRKSRPTSATEQ